MECSPSRKDEDDGYGQQVSPEIGAVAEPEFENPNPVQIEGESSRTPNLCTVSKCEVRDGCESESPNASDSPDGESASGAGLKPEGGVYLAPEVGAEYESEEHAYDCYSRYAVLEGFSIRKDFVNKSRIDGAVVSRRYTCHRQGRRSNREGGTGKKPREETRTGCLAHMTITRKPNGKFHVTHFEPTHNHDFATSSTAHLLPSQKRLTFAQAVEADLVDGCGIDGVPKLGLGFDSEDRAYEFYNEYAGKAGFSVRKDYVNRSKIDGAVASRRFTCFREGFRQRDKRDVNVKRPRKETRIGCLAQLVISRQPDGKYRVTHFEEKHNHELLAPCRVRMLRSQKRSVSVQVEGNLIGSSDDHPVLESELPSSSGRVCGNTSYDPIDYRSKLPSKHGTEIREGEVEKIQQYFQNKQFKNPSFFYSMQPDSDDQITNVFWADAKMVMDYSDFGDVVCFDTTYKLQKDCRPFALFIGINHHKQIVIFGAALLYDETIESYKWLFRTFVETMSGKKPKTILTDLNVVKTEAINSIFPEANHRMCVWHVYQNAIKQLGYTLVSSGNALVNDLSRCLFDQEEEDGFNVAWKAMLDRHGLWENEHLHAIYEERVKWAVPYARHVFCADMKRSFLGDNCITNLRKYLNPNSDPTPLLKNMGKLVNDLHYKELEANYEMSQHPPNLMGDVILLKHARDVYTPPIFEMLQREFETCLNIIVNRCIRNGELFEYRVSLYGQQKEYTVRFDSADGSVSCECMKFESVGILCSHALKVLDYRNLKFVPDKYILKRWTKDARV